MLYMCIDLYTIRYKVKQLSNGKGWRMAMVGRVFICLARLAVLMSGTMLAMWLIPCLIVSFIEWDFKIMTIPIQDWSDGTRACWGVCVLAVFLSVTGIFKE